MLFNACKIRRQKGRGLGHVTDFKFWVPLNISGTAKVRNLKFGMRIDNYEYYAKHAKLGVKGAWPRSRDQLLNFGTTSISPERLKIET